MSNNQTPGNAGSFRNLVEADKKSILEKLLSTSMPKSKSTNADSAKSDGKNGSTPGTQMSDYDTIFGDDVDDSEELFQDILKRAKEEFEKQKLLEKKYPDIQVLQDIFKKPAPKKTRKVAKKRTRAVEKTLAVMDNFKRRLLEPAEPSIEPSYEQLPSRQLTLPTISSMSNDYNRFKSSIKTITQGNQTQKTVYPTWKTTETYTPVFSETTNPNWAHLNSARTNLAEIEPTPVQNKLYTPGHISSWMGATTSSYFTEPPSCKSVRSDVAVHDPDSDDDSIKSIENTSFYFSPEYKRTENKSLTVICKTPSPKYKIIESKSSSNNCKTPSPKYKSLRNKNSNNNWKTPSPKYKSLRNKNSSADCKTPTKNTGSSTPPMRSTTVRFRPSPPEYFVYGSDGNSSISSDPNFVEGNENNSPVGSPQNYNEAYYDGTSISLQNSPLSVRNEYSPPCRKNIEYEEHHRFFSSSNRMNKIHKKMPSDSMKQPMFEDFVRQLNHNVSNNYNMEVKCSMKVKYYK